jgi:hypothetical protein
MMQNEFKFMENLLTPEEKMFVLIHEQFRKDWDAALIEVLSKL